MSTPKLPFQRSYWAVPGNLLAGCFPGDIEPEILKSKLDGLVAAGVTLVVNLMEETETDHAGRLFVNYIRPLEKYGAEQGRTIQMKRLPIVDMNIPTQASMRKILDTISEEIEAGGTVYVHCWGGKGRTGTVIGCYLLEHELATKENVLQRINDLTAHASQFFWPTPQTEEQCEFVTSWPQR